MVDVDVRFIPLLFEPLLLNDEIDEIDEKPFDGSAWKKSSINETPINGFINDDKMVLFCGWEWRWPPRRFECAKSVNEESNVS